MVSRRRTRKVTAINLQSLGILRSAAKAKAMALIVCSGAAGASEREAELETFGRGSNPAGSARRVVTGMKLPISPVVARWCLLFRLRFQTQRVIPREARPPRNLRHFKLVVRRTTAVILREPQRPKDLIGAVRAWENKGTSLIGELRGQNGQSGQNDLFAAFRGLPR